MDTDLARTFLEVSRTRHFGRAADNLCLTQSAVSARIRQLEEHLGCRLFARDRHNIRLTAAGRRLLPHAVTMVASWNRARQEVALPQSTDVALTVGALPSIWDAWFRDRLGSRLPDFADTVFSLEVHSTESLLPRLLDGVLDLAFLFEAPRLAHLNVREVGAIELVLVTSKPHGFRPSVDDGFIQVDWGASYANTFSRAFPGARPPALRTNIGSVARDLLLNVGGAAYLPRGTVAHDLAARRLLVVDDAPVIERAVFAAYAGEEENRARIERLLESMDM